MADPITIVQVVSASASLAMQCAQVAKGLHDLAGKYKNAEMNILSLANELDILRLAWERIESVLQLWEESDAADDGLLAEFRLKLRFGSLVVSSLANEIDAFTKRPFNFLQRTKYVWDEENFRGHQDRIRGQVAAVNLLVSVLSLPTAPARTDMLQEGASVLRQSDESALSIVPSRLSSRLSSIIGSSSQVSLESAELVYHQLTIDDDLFTARVYKRNYRHSLMLFKKNKGLALQKQLLTPSSDSVHTIDSTGVEPLQAHNIDAGVSEPKESVSLPQNRRDSSSVPRARWNTRGLYWITRDFIVGPAVTPLLNGSYLNNIEPYYIKSFVSRIRIEEPNDVLVLTGKDYRIWRTCLLLEACHQNRNNSVETLLQQDPTIIDGLWKEVPKYGVIASRSPLQLAVQIEAPELVRLLLDKGANHYASTPNGWATVQAMWSCVDSKVVEACLTKMNISVLLLAADRLQFKIVDVLLEKGLDVNAEYPDFMKRTALHRVVMDIARGDCLCNHAKTLKELCPGAQTLKVLLYHGAQWRAKDIEGNNIYHLIASCAFSVSHCLQIFLYEVSLDYTLSCLYTRNSSGKTPFEVAEHDGSYNIADIFKSEISFAKYRQIWKGKKGKTNETSEDIMMPGGILEDDSYLSEERQYNY